MEAAYSLVLKSGAIFTEAYTGNRLGIVWPTRVGGHICDKPFWNGCLANYLDRVVEIRYRLGEMPEVFFETENSLKMVRS